MTVFFIREFTVRKHERGRLFQDGDFVRFLAPAAYRFFDPHRRVEIERFDLSQPAFEHRLVDYLVRWHSEAIEDMFLRVETGAGEIAVITKNGHPWTVVAPERRALFWKGVIHVKAQLFDLTSEIAVEPRIAKAIAAECKFRRTSAFADTVLLREVPEAHVGLVYVDGGFVRELAPGVHAFWKFDRNVAIELFDLRVKTLAVSWQEVLTKDKVGLRISLNANYRFTNAQQAVKTVKDPLDFILREIQFGLGVCVGARSLDALLEDKGVMGAAVFEHVHDRFAALGIDVLDIGVKDVILPDDPVDSAPVYADLDGVLNQLARIRL
jgi:hypothetical protein